MEGEKKKPHLHYWKAWLLVITAIQVLTAIQNCQIHNQMWGVIYETDSLLMQNIQSDIEYYQNLNEFEERQTCLLEEQKQALEHQRQALEHLNQILKEYCK